MLTKEKLLDFVVKTYTQRGTGLSHCFRITIRLGLSGLDQRIEGIDVFKQSAPV
jgi:hypothetical protein